MVRAKARESERLSYAHNPASGTMLAAPAGGQAEAEFDFYNDSPDVASFYLEVDGLGPDWATGVGASYESYAAASGGGQLRLTLTPPLMATVGEYDFSVRLMSAGTLVSDATPLILRVDPPLEQPEEAPPPPMEQPAFAAQEPISTVEDVATPEAAEPAAKPASNGPARTRPAPKLVTPSVSADDQSNTASPTAEPTVEMPAAEPQRERAPEPAPAPTVHLAPPPAAPAPPVRPTPPAAAAPPPAEPPAPTPRPAQPQPRPAEAAPPPAQAAPPPTPRPAQPQPQPRPAQAAPPPAQAAPPPPAQAAPPPAPTPRPAQAAAPPVAPSRPAPPPVEEPVLIDYAPKGGAAGDQAAEEAEEQPAAEPFQMDPKDGAIIALRPGETMLLRFPFVNEGQREQTYILDEDRALEESWLTLVQDQVNLARHGQGELSVRLTPPINADPGDFPFTITTGPQGGQLTPRVLTLSILATPAVALTAKEKLVKVGPFSSDIVFPLSVESAGNADTAFRIAVKAPNTETADGTPVGSGDMYETPQWRYLFDREMETLRSPMSGQTPRPVPIQLRVRRKGIWWFGFKEQHQVRVAAVPVTEPGNGGKTANSLELTAVRSRIVPFPLLLLIPIALLIALFLSGGASDMTVTDGAYQQGNAYWIVNPQNSDTKKVALQWTARPLAALRFTGAPQGQEDHPPTDEIRFGSGSFNGVVPVSSDHRDVIYHFRVSRVFGGDDQDVLAHFIYTRADTPLAVTNGTTHESLSGSAVTLTVPSHGFARLDIKNLATRENRLDWWMVKGLDDSSANKFLYIKSNGSLEPGATEHFLIERNPSGSNPGTEEQIVLISTDANRPVLTVNLKPGQ